MSWPVLALANFDSVACLIYCLPAFKLRCHYPLGLACADNLENNGDMTIVQLPSSQDSSS